MKKLFLIAAFAAATVGTKAQISFGAQVGANLGNVKNSTTYTIPGFDLNANNRKVGGLIGLVVEVPVMKGFSFRPELNFVQKGFIDKYSEAPDEVKTTLNFIELPLNIVYTLKAGPGSVFAGVGPSLGYGISGKIKMDNEDDTDVKFDGDANATSTDDDFHMKAFDLGINVMAGYKLPMGVFLTVGYTHGFSDLSSDDGFKYKTNGIQLKLGYTFGNNK